MMLDRADKIDASDDEAAHIETPVRVRLENVSYAYPVVDATQSLKKDLFNAVIAKTRVGGQISSDPTVRKGGKSRVMVKALDGINIDLGPGDRLGILGANGAGKSTLLRMIAGLLPTSSGALSVKGRLIPLLQQGVGIQPEFTGRQNIELPLRLLGATDDEVARAKRDIPDLIELGSFLDLPVRTYSDGMRARLSFGISTFLKGDILLLDEWIGTGDAEFIAKAHEHLHHYLSDTGILVLATHGMDLIQANCTQAIVMDSGRIIAAGAPDEMVAFHLARMGRDHASPHVVS